MKILVVDDSNIVRAVVKQALGMAGYTDILEAPDGIEALKIAKTFPTEIGLSILDVNMPNLDGISLVGELRKIPIGSPIIMLTTETDKDKMSKAKDLGATGWIVKPFENESFIKVVNMFLKK
jgi:two-component system, chemotaxis family, chemotaxis protein CheY